MTAVHYSVNYQFNTKDVTMLIYRNATTLVSKCTSIYVAMYLRFHLSALLRSLQKYKNIAFADGPLTLRMMERSCEKLHALGLRTGVTGSSRALSTCFCKLLGI